MAVGLLVKTKVAAKSILSKRQTEIVIAKGQMLLHKSVKLGLADRRTAYEDWEHNKQDIG